MKYYYIISGDQVSFRIKMILFHFIFFFSVQILTGQANRVVPQLLPGSKVYDVTKPQTYGGTIAATPNNPNDDDALAINEALSIATKNVLKNYKKNLTVFQQIILIPKGDYHLSSTIALVRSEIKRENGIWIYGEGIDNTRFILKNASEIGEFGTSKTPKPLLQYGPYVHGKEGAGNTNFQLWGTDYSIIIPKDQPNAIGMSYGCANMGGLRNVLIKAEANAGHTGLAMIQFNNGPGWIENVTVEGFNMGIDVSDGWGEIFTLKNILVKNQNKNGIGIRIADKLLAIEGLTSDQVHNSVTPILLHEDDSYNSEYGGAPHLTLLNSKFISQQPSNRPVVEITKGHCFIRNIETKNYGKNFIKDHGINRQFDNSSIKGEYVSVHGKTASEAKNVILTYGSAPNKTIQLPFPQSPEIKEAIWQKLASGNCTIVSAKDLIEGKINIKTEWVIVDPTQSDDDTQLLQAALNSGAKYVGLLNHQPFHISKNLVVNANKGKVELIYGHMSEILSDKNMRLRKNIDVQNDKTLLTFETGSAKEVTIKGIHFICDEWNNSDMLLFQNNAAQTLIFEDLRSKQIPRAYRNGKESYGKKVFFENVEFAYTGAFYDKVMCFDHQKVMARQFNLEAPIVVDSIMIDGRKFDRFTTLPKLSNNGSEICVLSQKLGELNGMFVETLNGGKTELLSAYFNSSRTQNNTSSADITNFMVSGKNSDFCVIGQERIRTDFVNGNATRALPNRNKYGKYVINGKEYTIDATSLPTYLEYEGFNPLNDSGYETYDQKNHFRMTGLLRIKTK